MIVETLRRSLFERPGPPDHRGGDFAALTGLMFPVRAEFLRLLDSRDSQTQIEAAKKILLALAYESAVFPPNKFIRNLLDFESHVAGEAGGGSYVARDHFLHLVHLYLIGLYTFWYHSGMHKKVCDEFRRILPKGERHRRAVLRAALSAWKTFVLFHDLGYPWEATQQTRDSAPYLEAFTQVHEYAAKDQALFALSQLVALEWMMLEENTLLGEIIDDLPEPRPSKQREFLLPPRDWPEERQRLDNARRIPLFADRAVVLLIEQIVQPHRLVPVLESIADEQPCASASPAFDQFLRSRGTRTRQKVPTSDQVEEWALDFEVPTDYSAHFRLAFYARDFDDAFDQYLKTVFSFDDERLERPDMEFRSFARKLLDESPPDRPAGANPRFNEFAFAVYQKLLETLDFDTLDLNVRHSIQLGWTLSSHEYSGLQGIVLRQVTQALGKRLAEKSKELSAKGEADIAKIGLSSYLKRLLRDLEDADLPSALEESLSDELRERVKRKSNLYRYYRSLRDPISTQFGAPLPCFVDGKVSLTPLATDQCGQEVEALLGERGLSNLSLVQNYRPHYAPKSNYTDHGVAAGALLAVMHSGLRRMGGVFEPLRSLLGLRGRSGRTASTNPVSYDRFSAEILYTILIHNLYPSEFPGDAQKKFRTGMSKSAFSFFALFCDNLQHWDRRALLNQARGYLPYGVRAEHFNVEVVNNRFQITERGPQIEASERDQKLRKQLADFLEGGAQLIELSLTEWYNHPTSTHDRAHYFDKSAETQGRSPIVS